MYKAGDLHLVTPCDHDDERCADESTGQLRQVFDDRKEGPRRVVETKVVLLEHSCDYWVIGGPAEIRALIAASYCRRVRESRRIPAVESF